jgi:hypothetical protein
VDEVHISVTFTWDLPRANQLATEWSGVAPVKIGGPGIGMRGETFESGCYLKPGYVITSRGCPNRCWFCSVWKRDGNIRELPIVEGYNVLDDNLLACSDRHILDVLDMLKRQPRHAEFTGGLEAAKLQDWTAEAFYSIKPKQVFLAYDTPDDWEPLRQAANLLWKAGFKPHPRSHAIRAFVLIGYPKDTIQDAERRLMQVVSLGIFPMAMLWRDKDGKTNPTWRRFQRLWARPGIIAMRNKI